MQKPAHNKGPCGVSMYKGVCITRSTAKKNRWRSVIYVNARQKYLGTYDTEMEAAKAYDIAARKFLSMGNTFVCNFPYRNNKFLEI